MRAASIRSSTCNVLRLDPSAYENYTAFTPERFTANILHQANACCQEGSSKGNTDATLTVNRGQHNNANRSWQCRGPPPSSSSVSKLSLPQDLEWLTCAEHFISARYCALFLRLNDPLLAVTFFIGEADANLHTPHSTTPRPQQGSIHDFSAVRSPWNWGFSFLLCFRTHSPMRHLRSICQFVSSFLDASTD